MRELAAWSRLTHARFDYARWVDLPPGDRILTLSPHPDDDAFGVGGTLLKHHHAGCEMVSLVLTDGGADAAGHRRAQVVQVRQEEQRAAAAHLGIQQVLFWDVPDGGLTASQQNADRLRDLLAEMQPDLVYLPSFLDSHPDHRIATALLAQAIQNTNLSFYCGIYETTTPILPNTLVDISTEMETKLAALGEHQSQLASVDYIDLVSALNRWRSGTHGRTTQYAEAFYMDRVHAYLSLWQEATRR